MALPAKAEPTRAVQEVLAGRAVGCVATAAPEGAIRPEGIASRADGMLAHRMTWKSSIRVNEFGDGVKRFGSQGPAIEQEHGSIIPG